jgi:hypothetical protein
MLTCHKVEELGLGCTAALFKFACKVVDCVRIASLRNEALTREVLEKVG